jgi:hypothetical protein
MANSDIQFDVRGLTEYDGKLAGVEAKLPDTLKRLMTKGVLYAQSQIPAYPQASPGSSYRRTGTLGRVVTAFPGVNPGRDLGGGAGGGEQATPLTRVEMLGGDVRGVIGGRLSYLPDVVGDEQSKPFRGRWWQLKKVIEGAKDGIVSIYRAGVIELFKTG